MPRGRHRHSPPLHRLLPPSAIAGVSLVCAFGPWVFTEPALLRVFAALAAATALVGAAVMRRWDAQAGKQVADLSRARESDEWRHEERAAELETDLEESRELRAKLEQRLRAKRAELAALRNEHAALLRRYATAETERATALEGRRLLEIEAAAPSAEPDDDEAGEPAERSGAVAALTGAAPTAAGTGRDVRDDESEEEVTLTVFSSEGSGLFLRAAVALSKLGDQGDDDGAEDAEGGEGNQAAEDAAEPDGTATADTVPGTAAGEPSDGGPADETPQEPSAAPAAGPADAPADKTAAETARPADAGAHAEPEADAGADAGAGARQTVADEHMRADTPTETTSAAAPSLPGAPSAVTGEPDASARAALPSQPVRQPSGHFTVPTAVAVVPAAPARRPAVQGGFDFFGTQKGAAAQSPAMESAQNEHPMPGEGQETPAVHKPESEAAYKPAQEGTRAVGQVIDLTAHDETEHIDLQGLRTAAS